MFVKGFPIKIFFLRETRKKEMFSLVRVSRTIA
jgi:hypothetical protein